MSGGGLVYQLSLALADVRRHGDRALLICVQAVLAVAALSLGTGELVRAVETLHRISELNSLSATSFAVIGTMRIKGNSV